VFATVMSLIIILLGLVSYTRLPVREYPDIDPPVVSIVTFYRGASPNIVETEITDVLEEELATIEGVKTMESSSQEQGSSITIEFELGRNVDEAANDVRAKVSRILGSLPREADDPVISKVDVNSQPIVWLALYGKTLSNLELSDFGDRVLKDKILRVPGVASVFLGGERKYAMRVWLDPQRMASRDLTASDVEAAIRQESAEIPGGRIEGEGREFSVRTRGEVYTPEQFAALIVKQSDGEIVRLGDVAEVELGAEDERTAVRWNGEDALGLGIVKQTEASTIDVADAVEAALPDLRKILPAGAKLDVAYNSANFIKESITEVRQTIIIASLLVVIVILLFLKSFRAAIIPTFAIPTSIIGAFVIVFVAGYTINILTLLAMVLAIGIVVDDAIVMLENVYRHMQMGKTRFQAALDGANEIGFAILATTVTLVAVFVPLSFLSGNVGKLFREFGISVAVAVLISGFVALTITPMLCSLILRPLHGASRNWASRSFDSFFEWMDETYDRILRLTLRRRWLVIVGSAVIVVSSLGLFRIIPSELVPTEDRGVGFGIVIAPEGSTLNYTDRYMWQVEGILLSVPECGGLFTATGLGFGGPGRVTNGFVFMQLKPHAERQKSQQQIVQEVFYPLISIPGVLAFMINPPSLGQSFASPIQYVLQAESYEELQQAVGVMMGKAGQLGYLLNLDTDLRLNKPQLDLTIDRERAAQIGVSVSEIGTTIETMLGGRVVTNFKRNAKQYDVITQLRPHDRSTPSAIDEIYVRGIGGLVQLATVVDVNESVAPKELNHFNRVRSATISASIAPNVSLGQALTDLDAIADAELPPGITRELSGISKEYRDSSSALYFLFLFALVFIYLVLAAQFESFIHPLTILLSVPLALVGDLVSLYFLGQSINIYSQIGLIMLIGLVTKNSILIVEFANQLCERGLDAFEAVIEASRTRLRPILMTSFATVFGVLPIAIGLGAGAESRRPLGIAVVGGMIFSTFLTLVLVPAVYTFLARFTRGEARRRAKNDAGADVTAAMAAGTSPD
jgi:multidrug efflux pump